MRTSRIVLVAKLLALSAERANGLLQLLSWPLHIQHPHRSSQARSTPSSRHQPPSSRQPPPLLQLRQGSARRDAHSATRPLVRGGEKSARSKERTLERAGLRERLLRGMASRRQRVASSAVRSG